MWDKPGGKDSRPQWLFVALFEGGSPKVSSSEICNGWDSSKTPPHPPSPAFLLRKTWERLSAQDLAVCYTKVWLP